MNPSLQIGLDGTGNPEDFLIAASLWVGILLAALVLGKLFDTYIIDIWK